MIEPTKPAISSPSGCSETGSWLIPYSWRIGDGLADRLGRPGEDERRERPGVVAVVEQVLHPDDRAGRREQAVGAHPLVVVDLRQVAPAAVGEEDDDDGVRAALGRGQVADDLARGDHRGPARAAGEDPSSRVRRRAIANASRSLTRTQRSTTVGS